MKYNSKLKNTKKGSIESAIKVIATDIASNEGDYAHIIKEDEWKQLTKNIFGGDIKMADENVLENERREDKNE